ncbi:hypothetical protein MPTK1_6g13250 [Marchantia polymorpha subsp. ruderalis]|nr:hypothetical protein MARPO_0059s0024 [Marchantia polymorpha]BBN14647.1 hypothetical protein Mp_6g13250 [Marchantia polymorpha subsp. ruderalis]|eukprot:PTQ37072.1 hypothetical protein MARPO_0059s0024 [Marchantia polymorpha]
MAHCVVFSCSNAFAQRLATCSLASSSAPGAESAHAYLSWSSRSAGKHVRIQPTVSRTSVSRVSPRACADPRELEIVRDEAWEKKMLRESRERDYLRQKDEEERLLQEAEYRTIGQQLLGYPQEEVRHAKKFVSSLIRAGSVVEEMIVEAAENNELTPVVLLVIKNRLELARHDDERDAIQALDLLYRRIETEMLQREAPLALQFLNELLNLHDGFSHEEWLLRSRQTMIKIFPPEDAFTFLGSPDFDLYSHHGPIEMPEEEDDVLLRVDFIREVDNLLQELEAAPELKPITGFDPASIALRLRQEEKKRAIAQVKDLRKLAATLKW